MSTSFDEESQLRATIEAAEARLAEIDNQRSGGTTASILFRQRRLRDRFFPADMFADPAWDILLDLHDARLMGRKVSVSSLCVAASVPPTTALRHIEALAFAGVLKRSPDPFDRRRAYVAMTDDAAKRMTAYLTMIDGLGAQRPPAPASPFL